MIIATNQSDPQAAAVYCRQWEQVVLIFLLARKFIFYALFSQSFSLFHERSRMTGNLITQKEPTNF